VPDRERVLLILKAEGEGPPLPIRLRRLLKSALRGHGLRCVWVSDATGWQFGDDPRELENREPLRLEYRASAETGS
jgi:hypothetical protein